MTREEVYDEYTRSFDYLLKCTTRLYLYLYNEMQESQGSSMPYLSSRTKDLKSVAYKIEQEETSPASIFELKDLIGIRIVCLTESIVDEVVAHISTILNIIERKDTKLRLGDNQFGYTAVHLIGKITKEDSDKIRDSEAEQYIDQKYEIQVKTFAQHIFADLSHKYSYKSGKYIPPSILRALYRVAALSEVIDEEIGRFEIARDLYLAEYHASPEEEISIENLKLFLSKKLDAFRNIGDMEDYSGIVADLHEFGIKTIIQLNDLIDKNYEEFLRLESRRLDEMIEILGRDNKFLTKFIEYNYFYSYTGTVRGILNQEFKTSWVEYKQDAIDRPMWQMIKRIAEDYKGE